MASASTCCVVVTRRNDILLRCCRLAMLRGHSQKCTLPSRVLEGEDRGEGERQRGRERAEDLVWKPFVEHYETLPMPLNAND